MTGKRRWGALAFAGVMVVACSSGSSGSSSGGGGPPAPTCKPGEVRIVGQVGGASIDETYRRRQASVNQLAALNDPSATSTGSFAWDKDERSSAAFGRVEVTWKGLQAKDAPFPIATGRVTVVTEGALAGKEICATAGEFTLGTSADTFRFTGIAIGACPGTPDPGYLTGCAGEK